MKCKLVVHRVTLSVIYNTLPYLLSGTLPQQSSVYLIVAVILIVLSCYKTLPDIDHFKITRSDNLYFWDAINLSFLETFQIALLRNKEVCLFTEQNFVARGIHRQLCCKETLPKLHSKSSLKKICFHI